MMIQSPRETERKNSCRNHLIAVIAICLFSLYYFVLQSQSHEIGDYKHLNVLIEPEMLDYYQQTSDIKPYSPFVIPPAVRKSEPAFMHSLTFIISIRVLNALTGHTAVTIKLLLLPKLIIYLLGIYALLYYLTKRMVPSVLVSILSIVPRFMPDDHWGIGPVFSSEPKCFVYAFAPLVILLFLKYRHDLMAMCLLYFGVGCLGNIHPGIALNISLLLSFTQLWERQKIKDKLIYSGLPLLCALAAVFPYFMVELYRGVLVQRHMQSGLSIVPVIKAADDLFNETTLALHPFPLIRYLFNFYTLIIFLPFGFYYFIKKCTNSSTKKVILLHFVYTFVFLLPCFIYVLLGQVLGGWFWYICRTSTLSYLYIFIFITYAIIWLMDSVNGWFTRRETVGNISRTGCFITKLLVLCLVVLIIYPPLGVKPNRHFPKYDFGKQLNAIKAFFRNGIVIGAIDSSFTNMANYAKKLSIEATFTTRCFDALIFLARVKTYEIPTDAKKIDEQLCRYDNLYGRSNENLVPAFAFNLLFPANFSYEKGCKLFVEKISKHMNFNKIDYAIIDKRYSAYLDNNLNPIYSNDKYILCSILSKRDG